MPDATHVRLETWALEPAQSALTINLHARPTTARCPLCGRRSKRVHSRYQRTLADLPWGEHAVTVLLKVRRLFCDNTRCKLMWLLLGFGVVMCPSRNQARDERAE